MTSEAGGGHSTLGFKNSYVEGSIFRGHFFISSGAPASRGRSSEARTTVGRNEYIKNPDSQKLRPPILSIFDINLSTYFFIKSAPKNVGGVTQSGEISELSNLGTFGTFGIFGTF